MSTTEPVASKPARPAGIWFYAAVLLGLGGVILAYAVLLLPTVGMHARMWFPLLYIVVTGVIGSLCAALGAGLWSRVDLAWKGAVCLSGGGGLYALGLCVLRLGEQVASGIPLTQYGIPWRTTLVLALVFSYLYGNRNVRAFFAIPTPLPRSGRLRLAAGGFLGLLAAAGLHGLLLVTLSLFPGGDPLAGAHRHDARRQSIPESRCRNQSFPKKTLVPDAPSLYNPFSL